MNSYLANENLLLGALALQMEFINSDDLIAATNEWKRDKSQSLGEILVRLGALTEEERQLLKPVVAKHLERHDNDPHKSLAALPALDQVYDDLTTDPDHDVAATVASGEKPNGHHDPYHTLQSTAPEVRSQRFEVLRPHAKGGLGKVSVARDKELGREVALKEIHAKYADHAESRTRFRFEAEITGGLEHPGIVPVYSLGAYDDGRPYYAMRFIRGETFREAINKHHRAVKEGKRGFDEQFSLRQLLTRFVAVCNAIQYAHDRAVLHRDLKPENIMLGAYGETLVVDWGLAKVLDENQATTLPAGLSRLQPSSSSGTHTLQGSAVGTPPYMSPEQAAGLHDSLGFPSDIYGLGATLYYLLADRPPIKGEDLTEILSKVRSSDFPPPREVNPLTPSPLNAICMKAMANKPDHRYPSARALAEDIERWLADEPVTAWSESFTERAARWMRKNRSWTVSAAAAVIAVAVVSSAALVMVNAAWAAEALAREKAADLAERNAALARAEAAAKEEAVRRFGQTREAVNTWLTGAAVLMEFVPGAHHIRNRLLEQAVLDYEKFAKEAGGALDLEWEQALAKIRLATVNQHLHQHDQALTHYREADRLLAALAEKAPERNDFRLERANNLTRQADLLAGFDEYSQAEKLAQEALAEIEVVLTRDTASLDGLRSRGAALFRRGVIRRALHRHEEAENDLTQALAAYEQVRAKAPDQPPQGELSQVHVQLGDLYKAQGDYDRAAQHIQQAIKHAGTLVAADKDHPGHRNLRAAANVYLSTLLRDQGDVAGEMKALRQALNDYLEIVERPRDIPPFFADYVLTRHDYAQLLHELGRTQEAAAEFPRVVDAIAELRRAAPTEPFYAQMEGTCRDTYGETLRDLERYQEAATAHQEAIAIFKQLSLQAPEALGYQHRLAVCQSHLGQVWHALGETDAAKTAFQEAIAALESLAELPSELPAYSNDLAYVYQYLGAMLADAGDAEDARRAMVQADDYWRTTQETWPDAPMFQARRAMFLTDCAVESLRDPARALELAQQARRAEPDNVQFRAILGAAHYRAGDYAAAASELQAAIDRRDPPDSRDCFYLAMAHAKKGDAAAARAQYDRALTTLQETRPGNKALQRLRQEAAALFPARPAPEPTSDKPNSGLAEESPVGQ